MRRQHKTTMASRDMQRHMRDKWLTNDRFIGVLSTEWTYMNQPLVQPQSVCMGPWDLRFICLEWHGILSVWYMSKLLSCRSLYIWLQYSGVKISVLSFATIVKPLHAWWVYERAFSLARGDTNQFGDYWLQISSYPYEVSPIAFESQYERITLMT